MPRSFPPRAPWLPRISRPRCFSQPPVPRAACRSANPSPFGSARPTQTLSFSPDPVNVSANERERALTSPQTSVIMDMNCPWLWLTQSEGSSTGNKQQRELYHFGDASGDGYSSLCSDSEIGVFHISPELMQKRQRSKGSYHGVEGSVGFFAHKLLVLRGFQQQLQKLKPTQRHRIHRLGFLL